MTSRGLGPARIDPYRNFKFRLRWGGRVVAGFSEMSAVSANREGGGGRRSPGRTTFDAVTLERGVTHDSDFEAWASTQWESEAPRATAAIARHDFRRNLVIEVLDEAGQVSEIYRLRRCWVSEFQALPDLDANANAVAIEHLKLENEGLERDDDVRDPREPGDQ